MSAPQEDEDQQAWAVSLARALRNTEVVDAATAARLRAARRRALVRLTVPPALGWTLPVGAVTAVLALASLAPWHRLQAPAPELVANTEPVDLFELLADERGPEFYQDLAANAEFYRWLAAQARERPPRA